MAALALSLASWWAFAPLGDPKLSIIGVAAEPGTPPVNADPDLPRLALDTSIFHAPLWVELSGPSPPEGPPPAPPSPPPLRLQLLAIVRDENGYRAIVYDLDADRVLVAAEGESLAGRVLTRVDNSRIELLDHGVVRTLSLRTDAPALPSGGAP